jgi:hypothetical protein
MQRSAPSRLVFPQAVLTLDRRDSVSFTDDYDSVSQFGRITANVSGTEFVLCTYMSPSTPEWSLHWPPADIESELDAAHVDSRDVGQVVTTVRELQRFLEAARG